MSQMVDELNSRETVTLGALFLEFAKIGLCGIGSLLAWARRVIVDDRHWMSEAEFAETLSLCQFLPGPEIANVSIYVGSKFRGPTGAIVAILGLTVAPLAVGLVLGTLYLRYSRPAVIPKILGGLSAAAAGLLIATGIKMLMPHPAIGEGVTLVKVGDRVIGTFHPRWFGGPLSADYLTDRLCANLDGGLAGNAGLSEEALVLMPSHLSYEEAATLHCAAVTAWVALTGHRRVAAGDTVLTQGSGGVLIFALQFALLLGAQGIATTSSAAKAERLKALGAAAVVNYVETPDWHEKIVE